MNDDETYPLGDIFGECEHDGTGWRELHDMFATSLAVLPSCAWRPRVAFPQPTNEDYQRAKRQAFEALTFDLEEAVKAVLHNNRENEWPEMSQQACFLLTVALDQILGFLELCYVKAGSHLVSLFRCDPQGAGPLIQWMFFRWWMGPGIERWTDTVLKERRLFDRYFDSP